MASVQQDTSKKPTATTIVCRVCKGDHWTTKCPYKATLGSMEELLDKAKGGADESSTGGPGDSKTSSDPLASSTGAPKANKYVPPSMRGKMGGGDSSSTPGGSSGGRAMYGDEQPSLRVSNLSEDTTDEDLYRLFASFGQLARCFLAKDRESGRCKGFAYVSYKSREAAEHALAKMNGHRFGNLIISVEWSTSR
jgi:translation initiation factor 3 subunit G